MCRVAGGHSELERVVFYERVTISGNEEEVQRALTRLAVRSA